ncbi:hypothetical protein [uncultured Bacteroides sp.]|uniref:hypothetical protein n=1 Tax=uncultured Bacteroides sp. TaxID=162156 RepID=UPI002AAB4B89|nr:hypothetical protein [uncultured Bacteroides sp.]
MELDDLKKSWNILDERLQKDHLINEEKLAKAISEYKKNTKSGIKRLATWQKISITIGVIFIPLIILLWVVLPSAICSHEYKKPITALCIFFSLTIIAGIGWDFKTYLWTHNTKIDEMPILLVAKRMNKFSQWMKYEVIAISVWTVAFTGLYYWVMKLYSHSLVFQIFIVSLLAIIDIFIIYIVYKKLIYNNLNNIKKNIDELKELNSAEIPNKTEEA